MKLQYILESCLYIDDLDAAEAFYSGILGLSIYSRKENAYLLYRLSRGMLLLFLPSHSRDLIREVPAHGTEGSGHLAFAVSRKQLAEWRKHLEKNAIPVEMEKVWEGGGHSLYFRDPAGNSLELATPKLWEFSDSDVFPNVGPE